MWTEDGNEHNACTTIMKYNCSLHLTFEYMKNYATFRSIITNDSYHLYTIPMSIRKISLIFGNSETNYYSKWPKLLYTDTFKDGFRPQLSFIVKLPRSVFHISDQVRLKPPFKHFEY